MSNEGHNHTSSGQEHQTVNWVELVESAIRELGNGPTLSAFGIARADCALVHIDYFLGADVAKSLLVDALATATGREAPDVYADLCPPLSCDCRSCVGCEKSAEARAKHIAAYTNVATWRSDPSLDAPSENLEAEVEESERNARARLRGTKRASSSVRDQP